MKWPPPQNRLQRMLGTLRLVRLARRRRAAAVVRRVKLDCSAPVISTLSARASRAAPK